jgi:hypothetical protein
VRIVVRNGGIEVTVSGEAIGARDDVIRVRNAHGHGHPGPCATRARSSRQMRQSDHPATGCSCAATRASLSAYAGSVA